MFIGCHSPVRLFALPRQILVLFIIKCFTPKSMITKIKEDYKNLVGIIWAINILHESGSLRETVAIEYEYIIYSHPIYTWSVLDTKCLVGELSHTKEAETTIGSQHMEAVGLSGPNLAQRPRGFLKSLWSSVKRRSLEMLDLISGKELASSE